MRTGQAFPSKYLTAADLQGHTRKLVIARYTLEEIGDEKIEKPVLYFEGAKKAMVLNKTNANMISEVLGDDEMDNWVGKEISIFPTKVGFKGERVDAIRVKEEEPPPPPESDTGEDIPF